jgi:hypothetical protein
LSMALLPFDYPGSSPQTVAVRVNGRTLPGRLNLTPSWGPYDLTVAASYLRPGLNEFILEFGYAISPREALPADFGIGATGVRSPVEVTAQAGSGFASIRVGDFEAVSAGAGLAVVVLDESGGKLVASKSFDIRAEPTQAQALIDFLGGLPKGRIVALAARPDALRDAPPAVTAALGSLGISSPPGGSSGQALAALGVKGATPGQALQQLSGSSAYAHVGPNADRRNLAVAVDFVRLTKVVP